MLIISFFLTAPEPAETYTLSLHDALPICARPTGSVPRGTARGQARHHQPDEAAPRRSEEHTSELQSLTNIVCRLLLEKKNKDDDSRRRITLPDPANDLDAFHQRHPQVEQR